MNKKPSPELIRLQRTIAVVLGTLAVLCAVIALAGVWPSTLAVDWFGSDTLRLRFAFTFGVLGVTVLAVLMVTATIRGLIRRLF